MWVCFLLTALSQSPCNIDGKSTWQTSELVSSLSALHLENDSGYEFLLSLKNGSCYSEASYELGPPAGAHVNSTDAALSI